MCPSVALSTHAILGPWYHCLVPGLFHPPKETLTFYQSLPRPRFPAALGRSTRYAWNHGTVSLMYLASLKAFFVLFCFLKINVTRIAISRAFGNFSDMDAPLALRTLRPLSEKRGSPGPGKRLEDRTASCSLRGRPSTSRRPKTLGVLARGSAQGASPPLVSSTVLRSVLPPPPQGLEGQTHTHRGPHSVGVLSQQPSASSL